MMNSTVGVNHTFTGWAHSALDYRDFYNFDVPQDYNRDYNVCRYIYKLLDDSLLINR